MGGRGASGSRGTTRFETLNGILYVTHDWGRGGGVVNAIRQGGGQVGSLSWLDNGKVGDVHVSESMRRQGIASEMWRQAQSSTGGNVSHHENRTEAGDAFARAVGGSTPGRSSWRGLAAPRDYRARGGGPDDVNPEPPADPVCAPGDLWRVGRHRLLVGDCTDMAAVEAMLAGDRADCMWTDPPYGVDYTGKTGDALTIRNDAADGLPGLLAGAFAVATAALKPGAAVYVASPPGNLSWEFAAAFRQAGWIFRQNLVWVKNAMVLGHADYHYRHEPILFGYTDGGTGRRGRGGAGWYGDNAQTSVFEISKPSRSEDHPTTKPVSLVAAHLANSCPRKGLVYEPFGGSGTTLLAAHSLGMRAAACEIDPRYADVILRRLEAASGIVPGRARPDGTTEPVSFI